MMNELKAWKEGLNEEKEEGKKERRKEGRKEGWEVKMKERKDSRLNDQFPDWFLVNHIAMVTFEVCQDPFSTT